MRHTTPMCATSNVVTLANKRIRRIHPVENWCYRPAMSLTAQRRNRLLVVERGHNVREITGAIRTVLRDSPGTSLAEVEALFRDTAGTAYLVATTDGFEVVVGMPEWRRALGRLKMTPEQNRQALAGNA